jgi:hypothetical protein
MDHCMFKISLVLHQKVTISENSFPLYKSNFCLILLLALRIFYGWPVGKGPNLKGQSHEKVGEMSVWGISLGPN